MAWGDRLESMILRETAKRLELFELSTEFDSAFFHDTLPLACSLDGYAHGRGQKIRTDTDAGIIVVGQDEMAAFLKPIVKKARGYVPSEFTPSNWRGETKTGKWPIYNALAKLTQNAGFKNPEEFWINPANTPAQEGWDKGIQAQYGRIIPRDILYPVEQWKK